MEHLTKQQIILLALLVSFVSSIATGIVTVSLLDQAPPAVTQTINRVVERTIEKAVVASTSTPQVTKETIVVKDDEAVVSAIAKVMPSVVRIYARIGGSSSDEFIGIGAFVSSQGLVLARAVTVDRSQFKAIFDSGASVSLNLVGEDVSTGFVLFEIEKSSDPLDSRAFAAAKIGDSDGVKLGQAIVVLGGINETSAVPGVISSVVRDGALRPNGVRATSIMRTNVVDQELSSHAILINLAGEIIGFKVGFSREDGYVPVLSARDYFGKKF